MNNYQTVTEINQDRANKLNKYLVCWKIKGEMSQQEKAFDTYDEAYDFLIGEVPTADKTNYRYVIFPDTHHD